MTNLVDNSIEGIAASIKSAAVFIPMVRDEVDNEGNNWSRIKTYTKHWGMSDVELIPEHCFDALLVIDHSKMPNYL